MTADKKEIYFVTGNKDKLREAEQILKDYTVTQITMELPELQGTPKQVAEQKTQMAFKEVQKPIFVDDTALSCEALNGMPGVYIKDFLNAIKQEGIVKMLQPFNNNNATAICSIGYCDTQGTKVFIGKCKGTIVSPRTSGNGHAHGWDPIFQAEGYNKTFAELTSEEKNQISHRKRALEMLREFLKNK